MAKYSILSTIFKMYLRKKKVEVVILVKVTLHESIKSPNNIKVVTTEIIQYNLAQKRVFHPR